MPSENQGRTGDSRERYPDVRDDIGEDPARWLDYALIDDQDAQRMARIRIKSIDSIDVARSWIEVERQLDRGPRKKIIAWLNERIKALEVIGERPDRLEARDGRKLPETNWTLNGEDWEDVDRSVGVPSDERAFAVATDGGEDVDE